jgi:UDP-4-amino-4,6-dideoxy-N-acetyl-beta-L-altrosamine transaminase
MSPAFLPYGRHDIDEADVAAVVAALRSDHLTGGPMVERFEAAFAEATGALHAVACNSGTAALHLATLGLGLGPGDAAIVPAMTFLATANAVRMTGAEVVFADVDPESGLITGATLADAIGRADAAGLALRALLPVHLNGQLIELPPIAAIAAPRNLAIVEDSCHALGESDAGAGRHSRAACFSTHPVKAIATGEGGVVTTGEAALADRMRVLRTHGMVRDVAAFEDTAGMDPVWAYQMFEIGWNYRLPEVSAALGLTQLARLPGFAARRRAIAAEYDRRLAPLAPAIRPVARRGSRHGWHLYAIRVDFPALGTTRAGVMKWLRARGIGTQIHYIPVHRQPYYRQRYGTPDLPGVDDYYARCLSIPLYPAMTDADVARVADALEAVSHGAASA